MASTPGSDGKSKVPVPAHFSCPVSMELMVDPVMVVTGHTYDRAFSQRWLESGNKTCPVTGIKLRSLELTPNFALRMAIQDWATANGIVLNPCPTTHSSWEVPCGWCRARMIQEWQLTLPPLPSIPPRAALSRLNRDHGPLSFDGP